MQFFIIDKPETPWGDYSDTLLQGDSYRDEKSGSLNLERTGPFIPPLTFPGITEIVVTDSFRKILESSNLTGFSFKPVIKHRIVRLEWEKWNQDSDEPEFYPDSGEPEDYILEGIHSQETAEQMPELWEFKIEETAHVERVTDKRGICHGEFYLLLNSWDGDDFIRAPEVGYTFVTEKAKSWLEEQARQFVQFRPATVR